MGDGGDEWKKMNVNNEAMPRAKTPELSPGLAAVNVTTRPALCRGPFRPGAAATLALGRKELPSERAASAPPRGRRRRRRLSCSRTSVIGGGEEEGLRTTRPFQARFSIRPGGGPRQQDPVLDGARYAGEMM